MRASGQPVSATGEIPVGIQVGHGVRPVATPKMFTTGTFEETGNDLDMAIEGDGFFQVQMPDGTTAYTRDGAFKMDKDGRLQTSDGNYLMPEIVIPADATSVKISSGGIVSVTYPNEVEPQQVGQIEIARFINPAGLSAQGKNLFKETVASGAPVVSKPGDDGLGTIAYQMLEKSNVNVSDEMVAMIVAQRAYESNSKVIQTSDTMMGIANALKR